MRILAVDWSGNASRAAARRCIWVAEAADGRLLRLEGGRDRDEVVDFLLEEAERDPAIVVGLDFAFGVPEWFARARGAATGREVWELVAREGDAWLADPHPPFWRSRRPRPAGPELRRTELDVTAPGIRPKSVFQLGGAGQVGTASLRGMPHLLRLAERFTIWPFDEPRLPLAVEIYPRLFAPGPEAPNEHARDAAAAVLAMSSWHGSWERLRRDDGYLLEGRIWTPAASSCGVRRLLAAGLVAGALCPFAGAASPPFSPVVVTRDSLALRCSPRDVAEVLLRFERALEAGNARALDAVFAHRRFFGFSIDGPTIRNRARLVPHLLRLHARGERIRVLAVEVGNSHAPGAVGFAVSLLRIVTTPPGSNHAGDGFTEALLGKGEVDCRRRQIYVWNAGAHRAESPCPEVPTANALRTVLACSDSGHRPNAQEVSRNFAVPATPLRFPRRCRPADVKTTVVGALRAFDLAEERAFATRFTVGANVQPYTVSDPPLNLRGRAEIAAFAARRAARVTVGRRPGSTHPQAMPAAPPRPSTG